MPILAAMLAMSVAVPARALEALPQAEASGPVSTASTGARCIGAAFDDTAAFQAAIDTGRTVYAPRLGGQCHLTRALVMRTPGQIFHGDGRARTVFAIEPDFRGDGVFVAKTGEPGPVWRDFAIRFAQPDTATSLIRYPPAFRVPSTPRFFIEDVACFSASTCIDMRGNSGGASIKSFDYSCFESCIQIDGSLDTVRIIDPHNFPFAMTSGQASYFMGRTAGASAVAIEVGRADDLKIRGGLFTEAVALRFFRGQSGPPFASIENTDFDGQARIEFADGILTITSSYFTADGVAPFAIRQTGGSLGISNSVFLAAANVEQSLVIIAAGSVSMQGNRFDTGIFDVECVRQTGESVMTLDANQFFKASNRRYDRPVISLAGTSRTIAIGNYLSDRGTGSGRFFSIGNDNPHNRFVANVSPGWPDYRPSAAKGVFLAN